MKKHLLLLVIAAGCSSSAAENKKPAETKAPALPARPATGSPLAFASATLEGNVIRMKAYNYADKTIGQYSLLARYYDNSGTRLGTAPDWVSFADPMMTCAPKSWCELHTPGKVPDGATRVEVTAKELKAITPDMRIEDTPVFEIPGFDWPKSL
jgi:hypothetical protein